MSRYLQHFTWVLMVSIPVVIAITAPYGRDSPPLWGLPLWFAVVSLIAIPVHFLIERATSAALLRKLRAHNPAAPAVPVRVSARDAMRLLTANAPARIHKARQRSSYANTSARAIDRMVVVATDGAVEFWTGPVPNPTLVASFAWSDVQLPNADSWHVVVRHQGEVIARLSPIDEQSFTQRVASAESLRSAVAELNRMRP